MYYIITLKKKKFEKIFQTDFKHEIGLEDNQVVKIRSYVLLKLIGLV